MQGIAYIIRHNFFCLKLICPDIKRLCLIKNHPGFFLPDHDIHGGKNAFDQCSQVKTLHNSCVFSGFQLIQRKKILYQLIHLGSFINNDVTVKIHAFRIIINVLLQTFCIPLHKSNGCLQLMGNIIQKLFSHFIDFHLIFNILLQLIVCRFQLGNSMLQLTGHLVKIISQHINFIAGLAFISGFKIKICHLTGKLRQRGNRSGQLSGYCHNTHSTYNNNDNSYKEIKLIGNICAFLDTFQRASDQEIIAVVKLSPALYIIHANETVMYLLNHTVICLFQNCAFSVIHIKITGIAKKQLASQLIFILRPAQIFRIILIDNHPGQIIPGAFLNDLRRQFFLLAFHIVLCHRIRVDLTEHFPCFQKSFRLF